MSDTAYHEQVRIWLSGADAPVDIDAVKAVRGHKVARRINKCRAIARAGRHLYEFNCSCVPATYRNKDLEIWMVEFEGRRYKLGSYELAAAILLSLPTRAKA